MSAEQNDRVVFPDEVEQAKQEARAAAEDAPEEAATVTPASDLQMRNMITVPPNCPPGYKMDSNGVCREMV